MFWNKINVDNLDIILKESEPYYLEIDNEVNVNVKIMKDANTKLVILGKSNYQINIVLDNNASLLVNSLNMDNDSNVNIELNEKSMVHYNHSTLTTKNSENTFNINHLANDSVSYLNNNGINMHDGKLFFIINGVIPKNLENISCNQSSKIINFSKGNSKIIPNLIIDSNDIIANHAAYIGEINEEEMFYMKSRGLNEKEIKKLIYKAVLLGKMDLSMEEEEFNKIINEWW